MIPKRRSMEQASRHLIMRLALFLLFLDLLIPKQTHALEGPTFGEIVNKGLSRDPYDPLVAKGLIVPKAQIGPATTSEYEEISVLRLDYYVIGSIQLSLVMPDYRTRDFNLGSELRLRKIAFLDRSWLSARYYPDGQRVGADFRTIIKSSERGKFHFKTGGTFGGGELISSATLGHHSYPFASSRNTFIDIRGRFIQHKFEVRPANLDRNLSLYGLAVDIGHGWADFANIPGLETSASMGYGYDLVSYNTANCIGTTCDGSDTNGQVRLIFAVLYQFLPR